MNSNISGPRWATEKLWYVPECSAPADSETPLTFIPTSILRGSMALQSQRSFFLGHPVSYDLYKLENTVEALVEIIKEHVTRKKIEELMDWITVVFHYFASYVHLTQQRHSNSFLLNVVQ